MNLILSAARFAASAHAGQVRKYSAQPYIIHPRRVAGRLAEELWTEDVHVAAGWNHDVPEDCNVPIADIEMMFGKQVAAMVDGLTNKSKGLKLPRAERKRIDRERIAQLPWDVKAIKLIDRTDNLLDMLGAEDDFLKVYAKESRELLAVLQDIPQPHLVKEYVEALEKVENWIKA